MEEKEIFRYIKKLIPYVVIVGSQELEAGAATVKDMRTGEQRQVSLDKLATEICNS